MKKQAIGVMLALFGAASPALADDYVAIAIKGKVFDQASATGYVTQNAKNQDVVLTPGMAFKVTGNESGWDIIEYTSGLRGYIMKTIEAEPQTIKAPEAGSYKVANDPSVTLTVTGSGDTWEAKVGSASYTGTRSGNIIVFYDPTTGNQAYSLVNINGKPTVMSYSNTITNFF